MSNVEKKKRDRANHIESLFLLDMSQIKKFFSKVKSEVKFSRAGEGHRLNEPTATPRAAPAPVRPATTTNRQSSDGGAASRAAAEAAQQRYQHQTSLQQAAAPSRKTFNS